jgi:biopolymer transport protein ExbD/biopolymer transport protein TolR
MIRNSNRNPSPTSICGFFVNKKEVIGVDGLLASLNESSENKQDRRIHVRGDKSVAYGRIVEAMGIINAAGYAKVALVSETPAAKTR